MYFCIMIGNKKEKNCQFLGGRYIFFGSHPVGSSVMKQVQSKSSLEGKRIEATVGTSNSCSSDAK